MALTQDQVEQMVTEYSAKLGMPRPPVEWPSTSSKWLPPVRPWIDGFQVERAALDELSKDEMRFAVAEALALQKLSHRSTKLSSAPITFFAVLLAGLIIWRLQLPQPWHWPAIVAAGALALAYIVTVSCLLPAQLARKADRLVFSVFRDRAAAERYLEKAHMRWQQVPVRMFRPSARQLAKRVAQLRASAGKAGVY